MIAVMYTFFVLSFGIGGIIWPWELRISNWKHGCFGSSCHAVQSSADTIVVVIVSLAPAASAMVAAIGGPSQLRLAYSYIDLPMADSQPSLLQYTPLL